MPPVFAAADKSPYQPGSLFLGRSDKGREIGIQSERHFITVCGSGSGKGVSLIIPNLLRWIHNSLVIDPGGGNVRATWQAREAMGQTVHVIDPARVSLDPDKFHPGIPERLLKSFNPLAKLDPSSRTYGEDVDGVADGLVMRHDNKHARWDNGAANIIAGLIDFITTDPRFRDHATLPEMRRLLIQSPDNLKAMFEELAADTRPALCRAAAATALADLKDTDGGLVQNAQENTKWLDYTSMRETLGDSTCELSDLKTKPCTVYLVIDPDYMDSHGRFLRLFVRSAVSAMAKGGDNGRECLFILDEFFSLGKIDYLQKVVGMMRKNGVHLWPILQDLGQIITLYGPEGAATFFGNADAHIFFGNTDAPTLDYVSGRLGMVTPEEVGAPPMGPSGPGLGTFAINNMSDRTARLTLGGLAAGFGALNSLTHSLVAAQYQKDAMRIGRPRLAADAVRELIGKKDGDQVARSMIVFAKGSDVLNLKLAPYFVKESLPAPLPFPWLGWGDRAALAAFQSVKGWWERKSGG